MIRWFGLICFGYHQSRSQWSTSIEVYPRHSVRLTQSQSQRLPRSSLWAVDLTAELEAMAQHCGSIDDSIHLPNFSYMTWVGPSGMPTIVMMPLELDLSAFYHIVFIALSSSSVAPIHRLSHQDDA